MYQKSHKVIDLDKYFLYLSIMELFFKYATPLVYWVLILIWAAIFIFYIKKYKALKKYNGMFKLLLLILAIDAFRTFFESLYFGAWYTSYSGLLPISVFNFLAQQEVVFIPKLFNLIVAILVLMLIVRKWISFEIAEKKAINELVEKQSLEIIKLSSAVEQSANTIVITDIEGNIEYVNKKHSETSGYTFEESIGKSPRILNSGLQPDDYYAKMWRYISAGKTWKGEFSNKDKLGKLYWEQATISPIKNDANEIINYLAIKEDITIRRSNEQKLLEQNDFINKIIECSAVSTWIADKDGTAIKANQACLDLFEITREEGIGKYNILKDDLIEEQGFSSEIKKVFLSGKVANIIFDYTIRNDEHVDSGNNTLKIVNGIYTPILDENGAVVNVVCQAIDLTEIKKYESELIKAKVKAEESDQLKTEFLNNMSHEIRTPMNGILGFSDMLNDPGLTELKRKNFVNIIQNSGKQLLHVIDDIIEISRLGTNQVKVFEEKLCLNDLFFEIFSIFDIKAKAKKIPLYLKNELSDERSTIFSDKSKLNKILSNLLENALKFTNSGFIEFGYQLKNNELEIYVKDTGIGIGPEKHESIFNRFSQGEKDLSKITSGLGLGLSIVKENVELLGGKIRVESEKQTGTIFYVLIPYKPVNKREVGTGVQKLKTILIAEDEEVNYLFLEALIRNAIKLDVKILYAINGKEAVEFCKTNPDISLVLMDLKMPIMDGYQATVEIKKMHPNLTIVAQTAYSTAEDKEKAKSAGCDDFISKPIKKENFEILIHKYLKID